MAKKKFKNLKILWATKFWTSQPQPSSHSNFLTTATQDNLWLNSWCIAFVLRLNFLMHIWQTLNESKWKKWYYKRFTSTFNHI
jgi:hypothetical protein